MTPPDGGPPEVTPPGAGLTATPPGTASPGTTSPGVISAGAGLVVLHAVQPTEAGAAHYVAAVAADQLARGWWVVVACPPRGWLPAELDARGVPWLAWPAARGPGPRTAAEALRLRGLVHRVRPDVLHLHSAKGALAGRLAVRGSVPTLVQPHGWSWLAVRGPMARAALAWERGAARWADALVCAGDGEAELARRAHVGGGAQVGGTRVGGGLRVVVRNGVDLGRFTPTGPVGRGLARRALGINAGVPLVLCLGRISRQKGQDVLLAAWLRVRLHCPNAELAVVGGGPSQTALPSGPVPGGVRFAPQVEDPRRWYAAADLVVLPSRWEGLSLTLLEAMACGRPVVASAVSGLVEAVPADAGALVPADGPASLAHALIARLRDGALRAQEGRAARRAAESFDLRDTHQRLAELTLAVARRTRPSPARRRDSTGRTYASTADAAQH